MKKETVKGVAKTVIFFLPLGLTLYGYLSIQEDTFLNAAFKGAAMYVMNYGDTPPNLYVEIARWLAPLATASGLVLIFMTLRERICRRWRYLRGGSVAVYGDGADVKEVLFQLGKKGIRGPEGQLIPAERYILMFSDEERNYDFYIRNFDVLTENQVYLKSSSLRPQDTECNSLHFFQYEEAEARAYWKEYSLLGDAKKGRYHLNIVLIGGGKMGEALLLEGVQKNIFSPGQHIEYHVFYADEKFITCYPGLQKIEDPIIFHEEEWYQAKECICNADRILVSDQGNDVEFLHDLLLWAPQKRIDIFSDEGKLLKLLFKEPALYVHDAEQEGKKVENILNEKLFEQAKQLNLNYAVLYGYAKQGEKSREEEWRKLDAFTKYSNVSSVDYHYIRKQMLKVFTGSDSTEDAVYEPYLEVFAELEHIRWCRYHILNNWSYGIPENGKAKDSNLRIHHSLIPYQQLPEEEKAKDRDTVRFMFQWM